MHHLYNLRRRYASWQIHIAMHLSTWMAIVWQVRNLFSRDLLFILIYIYIHAIDIFLTCETGIGQRKTKSFQIWRNDPVLGFTLAGEWQLPDGAGAISFADVGESSDMALAGE
jgi:hypothetical protein